MTLTTNNTLPTVSNTEPSKFLIKAEEQLIKFRGTDGTEIAYNVVIRKGNEVVKLDKTAQAELATKVAALFNSKITSDQQPKIKDLSGFVIKKEQISYIDAANKQETKVADIKEEEFNPIQTILRACQANEEVSLKEKKVEKLSCFGKFFECIKNIFSKIFCCCCPKSKKQKEEQVDLKDQQEIIDIGQSKSEKDHVDSDDEPLDIDAYSEKELEDLVQTDETARKSIDKQLQEKTQDKK